MNTKIFAVQYVLYNNIDDAMYVLAHSILGNQNVQIARVARKNLSSDKFISNKTVIRNMGTNKSINYNRISNSITFNANLGKSLLFMGID